ncbi:pilus assembly protein TadC [Pelagivirga sediminicola]|uniref:Pilus assembly protein TadC n=1 Tax=Pelagivirga sediminicola TaxID=2170575 RepID=A0A2T7G7J0_9RHOB|nr:type II secretion system F family protein [Pelagivirga sediminicola]PVA10383.1 pilus assembly protein TadC [Pelagivirga sediminicola]
MTFFTDMLSGPMGELLPIIGAGILGLMLIAITAVMMMNRPEDPLDKLRKSEAAAKASKQGQHQQRLRGSKNDKLDKYAGFLEPQDEKQLSEMRKKLMQAGYRDRDAVRYFHFAQFALGVGGLVLGVLYYVLFKSGGETSTTQVVLYILGPGGVGYMAPKYWVTKRQQQRQEEITDGFPDSLDMMLVCVEAGQSLDQAIIRVSNEIRSSFPALADEYLMVSQQIKAGRDKAGVLNEMADRCGVQDISSFVTVLVQSQTFGTSIADALRVYASEMRDKRVMRAEEKANKLPTKMTLATMMFTVPPLLIILVGPSVLGIMDLAAMSQ